MPRPAGRASLLATLFFTILIGFLPIATSERSSSERSPALDAAEIFRDAPLYPPLQDAPLYAFQDAPLYPLRDAPQYPVQGADQTSTDLHTLQTLTDTNLEPKFNFQPFFDTNNEDESVEVIETEPETNIEESIVIPDETVLPETKDKRVYDSEPIGTDTQTPNNNEDVDNLFNNLTDETNLDLSDDNILDKDEYAPRKKSRIDDLLAEVEVEEENDEYKAQETSVSDAVMREILGGEEEDTERTKRSAGQDWDKSKTRRIKTGDTILNIRGAVRDGIGDAGAAPGTRASSRVDAFVIRPAALSEQPPPPPPPPQPPGDTRDRTKQERELLVEAHARARVACDLHNVTGLRWYRDNEIVNLASSPTSSEGVWREGDAVVVARATRALAGRWRCAGRDRAGRAATGQPTRLMIYEPVRAVYLAVDGRRLDAGNTWVPVRDRADLTVRCVAEGGVPPPELSWRLMALEPTFDHKPYLRINPTNYSIEGVWWSRVSLTAARELHNATLQCTARQRSPSSVAAPATAAPAQHLTAKLEIHVTYPPSFVISRWPGFGVALWAGGAAALRCDVDANPPARAAWTRHDRAPSSLAPVEEGGAGEAATLRWAVLRASHAGWYRCRARWGDIDYYSIGYYLNVLSADESHTTETQPEVEEPDHQKVEVPLGGNVQLHCPKGSVGCWWRRVVGNASDAWAPAGSHHAHGVLGIKEAVYEEGGEYRCVGARAPDLQRLRELKRVTLAVTGGATATAISAEPVAGGWKLVCGACGRNLRVLWLRGGRSTPAILSPDLAQHCWRAVLALPEPDEVWCVAAASTGGAVAVFPRRTAPSPAPARHAVRALHSSAFKITSSIILLATCTLF